ncbi:MAG: hypothetical protein ABI691_25445 [Ginsengibacter sp.]
MPPVLYGGEGFNVKDENGGGGKSGGPDAAWDCNLISAPVYFSTLSGVLLIK